MTLLAIPVVGARSQSGVAAAKGGGSGAANQVTYTGVTANLPEADLVFNGIAGDGGPYVGAPLASTTFGAFFMAYKTMGTDDFDLLLDGSGNRHIVLDLTDEVPGSATCGTGCRKPDSWTKLTLYQTWGPNGLRVRPIDATNAALPGGMEAIDEGETYRAIATMNFQEQDASGKTMIWKLSFASSELQVTRTSEGWTIQTVGGAIALLEASPDGSIRKRTEEGQYHVPFTIAVTR